MSWTSLRKPARKKGPPKADEKVRRRGMLDSTQNRFHASVNVLKISYAVSAGSRGYKSSCQHKPTNGFKHHASAARHDRFTISSGRWLPVFNKGFTNPKVSV